MDNQTNGTLLREVYANTRELANESGNHARRLHDLETDLKEIKRGILELERAGHERGMRINVLVSERTNAITAKRFWIGILIPTAMSIAAIGVTLYTVLR